MKDFHCEVLELSFRITPEEIDEDRFLKAIGIENRDEAADEEGDVLISKTFGRRETTTDYHGHMSGLITKEGKGRIDLSYHEAGVDIKDEGPPYVEEAAQWLADCFRKEEVKTRTTASFTFDSSYAPTIALPFPLATSEKALAGSKVVGVSIQFPEKEQLDFAVVQLTKDETFISIVATSEIRLKDFDLFAELERLNVLLDSLVRRREPSDETESAGQGE